MKTVTVKLDDVTWDHACRLAQARGMPLDDLIRTVIHMLAEPRMVEDPILGSMRDDAEHEQSLLAAIMQERQRRWDGVRLDE